MTTHQPPRDDQPGDYTGCWNQVYIQTVYPDTANRVWHFSMPNQLRGSYCGTFNRSTHSPLSALATVHLSRLKHAVYS